MEDLYLCSRVRCRKTELPMRWCDLKLRIQREPKDVALSIGWIGLPLVPIALWDLGSTIWVLSLILIFPFGLLIHRVQSWIAGVDQYDADSLERVTDWRVREWLLWLLQVFWSVVFLGGIGVMAGFVVRNLPK